MILSSITGKGLAWGASGVAHVAALVWFLGAGPVVEIEGSAGANEVRLGNSFADVAHAVATPDVELDKAEPAKPDDTAEPDIPDEAQKPPPKEAPQQRPDEALKPDLQKLAMVVSNVASTALPPVVAAVPPPAPSKAPPPEELKKVEPPQVLKPVEEVKKPRPKPKPKPKPKKKKKKKKKAKKAVKKKVAASWAQRAGASDGKANSRATTRGQGGKKKRAGNAAISNYPGKVMARIRRVPKPRVGYRGTTRVSFRVSPSGGLAGVSVSRGSGSARLDQAALRIIRRAAPFPRPPAGARRSFSISIRGQ